MNIKQFILVICVTWFSVVFAMKNDENRIELLAIKEIQILDLSFSQADEEIKLSSEETNKKLAKEIRINRFQAFLNNPSVRLKELQKLLSELPD